jgi:hypothetical protein
MVDRPGRVRGYGQGRLASGAPFNNARRMKNGNISSDIVLIAHVAERHRRAGWVLGDASHMFIA